MILTRNLTSVAVIFLGILIWSCFGSGWSLFFYLLGCVVSAGLGVVSYVLLRIHFSPPNPKHGLYLPSSALKMQDILMERLTNRDQEAAGADAVAINSPIISRNIDQSINEIIDLVSTDYILPFFSHLMGSEEEVRTTLKKDIWKAIQNLNKRLTSVDHVKLIAIDVVRKVAEHFEQIRTLQANHSSPGKLPRFPIFPHLVSYERECEYLSKVADVIMIFLFPDDYSRCLPLRHLLRELFARHVLSPAIDKVTNPDYINMKVLSYIKKNQSLKELNEQHKSFSYADSYEDFITLISTTNDLNEMKRIRYDILTEIMQASTMDNLRKAKGKSYFEGDPGKSEMANDPAHMKRYLNQLVHAKSVCDLRLKELSSSHFHEDRHPSSDSEKVLSLEETLKHPFYRKHFGSYLDEKNQKALLDFWVSVDELKRAEKTSWHRLATEIFYSYINKSENIFLQLDKGSLKKIESFLLGDDGPEIFFELQGKIENTLSETYFPAFLHSDTYIQMIDDAKVDSTTKEEGFGINRDTEDEDHNKSIGNAAKNSPEFKGKSNLEQICEKLQNKLQAMEALQSSLKPDSRVLVMLQKEIKALEKQRHDISQHLSRTDAWANYLGHWKCKILSVENSDTDKDSPMKVNLNINVPEEKTLIGDETPSWNCSKSVADFHQLHRKLVPYVSWVKSMELPSHSKSLFVRNPNSSNAQEKSRQLLQLFMDKIMEDDQLNQSELLYEFLSPRPPTVKAMDMSPRSKTHFLPFANFFRSEEAAHSKHEESDDIAEELLWLDDFDSGVKGANPDQSAGKGDAIAESIYALIGEVFDMRGVFKWIRKSLMTFVQLTYGSSINRQIRDTVDWITSEHMILFYLHTFKKSFWINGKLKVHSKETSSKSERDQVATETRNYLIQNIPEVLINLVGNQASIAGTIKTFETFQNVTLNKHLFYEILDLGLNEIFPEILNKSTDNKTFL